MLYIHSSGKGSYNIFEIQTQNEIHVLDDGFY